MADVFISYSRVDQPIIKQLSAELEANGFSVWWDRDLLGGDDYADDIERELIAAKAVIVSWSETGSKSRWVRDEAAVAADAGTLITISADGSAPPIGFRQFHCVDFSAWQGQQNAPAFTDILRAITAKIRTTHETKDQIDHAPPPSNQSQKSISKIVAVLPFTNRSPHADDAFFADGVHDELLTQISKLASIQVISRTSVMGYRDLTKSIPEIASELGAAVILEGAVQRAGKRVRINVQLIDGKSDTHIWADTYDRELTPENIFDIQSDITREIAGALHTALSAEDEIVLNSQAPTNNLAAYDAYLRGKQKMRSEAAGEQDFHAAIDKFDEAIAIDPNFAEPHANKARAYLTIFWFFGWDRHWVNMAKLSVKQAGVLAPKAVETMLAQAYFHYWGELDLVDAESALNQILSVSPQNTEAWACKSYVIRRQGRFIESISTLQKAMRLDPMLVDLPMELSSTLAAIGQFKQATQMLERAVSLAPRSNFTAIVAGDMHYCAGDAEQAYKTASMDVDAPDFIYYYRRAFHALNTAIPEYINDAFSSWPNEFHSTPMFPETYNLYYALACQRLGKKTKAQEILKSVKQRIDNASTPYPGGWMPEAPYFPVTLPGLMGDIQGVRDAVSDFEANAKHDQMGKLYHYHAIGLAFLSSGDINGALAYLEKLAVIFGACSYLPMSITPEYNVLLKEPRYQALKLACEKWQRSSLSGGN